MSHRLLLPLPSDYSNGEEYTTFLFDSHDEGTSHLQLKAYLDRLEVFLNKTRLIQYHPENYFKFLSVEGETLKHLHGSAVLCEEINYMRELCEAFQQLVHSDIIKDLSILIREGPPAIAPKCLHSFFDETKMLQLNRKRRLLNDAAQVTLCSACDGPFPRLSEVEERRRERVLEAIMGYGMGPKKKHEVAVMRATVADLVRCCNTSAAATGMGICEEPVETVINIGEGKGYVSRALALCDGLQVVGLDCNPAHKERVVERVEFLMEGRFSVDGEGLHGRDMLNLFYEPRGQMATIACRVEQQMDWAHVLRGHVRLCTSASDVVDRTDPEAPQGEDFSVQSGISDAVDASEKIQCRICEHIVRRGAMASIVRHIMRHLHSGEGAGCKELPSLETVNMWNCELSVECFAERIIKSFYTHGVQYGCAFTKRERASDGKEEEYVSTSKAWGLLLSPRLPRGTRAEAIVPLMLTPKRDQKQQEEQNCVSEPCTDTPDSHKEILYEYVAVALTIVGYDSAPNRHMVILDDANRKESFTLLQDDGATIQSAVHWPAAHDAWARRVAVITRVLPPLLPRAPAVHVPDLRNTALVGLHPCGDLGSSICRIFTESAARGLLLVSCCWHALTNEGFPLSMELRRRGWRTENLSLLLATQPHDMWATASSEGHRGSVRLLFFRSALKILWAKLAERWLQSAAAQKCCCAFAEAPHLEPSFLRRMAKVKDTIMLEGLYVEVRREYFCVDTGKQTAFSWHQKVCEACRVLQETFLSSDESIALAAQLGQDLYRTHFSSFMGLTVLRMWMCHLVESWLLLDRALYLSESLRQDKRCSGSVVSLAPLFDGAISPRMYGILALRIP